MTFWNNWSNFTFAASLSWACAYLCLEFQTKKLSFWLKQGRTGNISFLLIATRLFKGIFILIWHQHDIENCFTITWIFTLRYFTPTTSLWRWKKISYNDVTSAPLRNWSTSRWKWKTKSDVATISRAHGEPELEKLRYIS